MKSNHPQSWQFAFWALIACALFAVLVFKTGLHRSDVPAIKMPQIESVSERTADLKFFGTHKCDADDSAAIQNATLRDGLKPRISPEQNSEAMKDRRASIQTDILKTNKPAVRWGELGETKATNSPICK